MDRYFLTPINAEGPLSTIQRLKAKYDVTVPNFEFTFKLRCNMAVLGVSA
jgi:hypothetical protein